MPNTTKPKKFPTMPTKKFLINLFYSNKLVRQFRSLTLTGSLISSLISLYISPAINLFSSRTAAFLLKESGQQAGFLPNPPDPQKIKRFWKAGRATLQNFVYTRFWNYPDEMQKGSFEETPFRHSVIKNHPPVGRVSDFKPQLPYSYDALTYHTI